MHYERLFYFRCIALCSTELFLGYQDFNPGFSNTSESTPDKFAHSTSDSICLMKDHSDLINIYKHPAVDRGITT